MTWRQLTERNCREWKLLAINLHHRDTWRSGVRSAMHAASQLPGRGLTDVDIALYLHVNKKFDDDDDDDESQSQICHSGAHLDLVSLLFWNSCTHQAT